MFNTIEEAIADIKIGKMVIVVDDEDRENEGDLLMAAEHATPEAINFMATHARGLICIPLEEKHAKRLGFYAMVSENTDTYHTAFTVSIDAKDSTTGISAYERSLTIQKVMDEKSTRFDFKKPGHIFPLVAMDGGVLKRAGHTEASVDLARLAGLKPAGVICEIMKDDGTMARVPDLEIYAKKHQLKMITIASLIAYRRKQDQYVKRAAEASMPTHHGDFRIIGFENVLTKEHHVALVKGDIKETDTVLVRVHSECLTGDAFASKRCDCGDQLGKALDMISSEGKGILLYMRQEGRGIGLINKIKAYALQDQGYDTVEANEKLGFKSDLRNYGIGAQILVDLGVRKMRLITNNPKKMVGLEGYGLSLTEQVGIEIEPNKYNKGYLECKRLKMGHLINENVTP